MRVLVLGAKGMLGHKLFQLLSPKVITWGTMRDKGIVRGRIIDNFDVFTERHIEKKIKILSPDCVVNCIGVVKQSKEFNSLNAFYTNAVFPDYLNKICSNNSIRLIHISSDCVFSGRKGNYSELDKPDAEDLYGQSKIAGEVEGDHTLTIRTSMIGSELKHKHGLLEWFIGHANGTVKGFTKAIFTGFPTITLSNILKDIILRQQFLTGIYHVASEPISKYNLLTIINEKMNLGVKIEPDSSVICDRSLNADKFNTATGFKPKAWGAMIDEMVKDCRIS